MVPDYIAGSLHPLRGMRGPAQRMRPAAAVALFATTGLVWFLTTQPANALRLWRLGPEAPLSGEQWAVLFSSISGAAVLLAGLFAVAVYVVHRPAIVNREVRKMIVEVRAEMKELQVAQGRLLERLASLQQLRAEIAMYEAALLRADGDAAQRAGRVVGNGREVMDDIISELEAAGARVHAIGAE
jgi:hypothetical protein